MILEILKQRLAMLTMSSLWVLDVKKVKYELFGPLAEVGAPQADNDSSNPPENFHKNVFLVKSFSFIYYIAIASY